MTREQALIFTAYTGKLLAPFPVYHLFAQEVLGRSIYTHEFCTHAVEDAMRAAVAEDVEQITRRAWKEHAKGGYGMSKRELLVISAFTGVVCGPLDECVAFIEDTLGHRINAGDIGTDPLQREIRDAVREDFFGIVKATWPEMEAFG